MAARRVPEAPASETRIRDTREFGDATRDYVLKTYPGRWSPQTIAWILCSPDDLCRTTEEWIEALDEAQGLVEFHTRSRERRRPIKCRVNYVTSQSTQEEIGEEMEFFAGRPR